MDIEYIISLCNQSVPSWAEVTLESCEVKKLVGNSNTVFVISTSHDVKPKQIIYRVFGNGDTLNLLQTSAIFRRLASIGLAPRIYLESENFRLEEFVEGSRNIDRYEFHDPHMIELISKKLKEFHEQDLCDLLDKHDLVHMS